MTTKSQGALHQLPYAINIKTSWKMKIHESLGVSRLNIADHEPSQCKRLKTLGAPVVTHVHSNGPGYLITCGGTQYFDDLVMELEHHNKFQTLQNISMCLITNHN